MNRRAPETGYDFGNKRQYRRTVWARFREHCGTSRAEAQCLLMPSIEGTEIDVAKANGFREENLHVVDKNPAIVAHLRRRYPRIHTYGVDLDQACLRMFKAGIYIDVANFDLCSNAGFSMMKTLQRVGLSLRGICKETTLIAITMLRGREHRWELIHAFAKAQDSREAFADLFSGLAETDVTRIQNAAVAMSAGMALVEKAASIGRHCCVIPRGGRDVGIYRSAAGSQSMLWCLFRCSVLYEAVA